jgi:hypothetical protein
MLYFFIPTPNPNLLTPNDYYMLKSTIIICFLIYIFLFFNPSELVDNTSTISQKFEVENFDLALDLQIVILSRPSTALKRAAVRLSSLSTLALDRTYKISYFFLLSRPPREDVDLWQTIFRENTTHGDLKFSEEGVSDNDLSKKVWLALRTVALQKKAKFLLKIDDDHMVFYDRLLNELGNLSPERLLWGRRGSGAVSEHDRTIYTNSAYLMSADVLERVAEDVEAGTCGNLPGEDYCMGRSATGKGGAELFDDHRWFNDDEGDPRLCLCKHWTLEDTSALVIHHVRPQLMEAFARNKTLFSQMRYPDRNYAL